MLSPLHLVASGLHGRASCCRRGLQTFIKRGKPAASAKTRCPKWPCRKTLRWRKLAWLQTSLHSGPALRPCTLGTKHGKHNRVGAWQGRKPVCVRALHVGHGVKHLLELSHGLRRCDGLCAILVDHALGIAPPLSSSVPQASGRAGVLAAALRAVPRGKRHLWHIPAGCCPAQRQKTGWVGGTPFEPLCLQRCRRSMHEKGP